MLLNPLNQFLIKPIVPLKILNYNITITNSALVMVFISIIAGLSLLLALIPQKIIPSRVQMIGEIIYDFNMKLVYENIGPEGKKFLPLILTLFIFIIFCNLFGMLPYSFTVTSHIIITFGLAMIVFATITIYGFLKHGLRFLTLFLPKDIPFWLAPLMVIIELCVFIARPISLSLRLAANMVAGHVLLKIVAGSIASLYFLLKPLPMPLVVMLIGFEIFVSILQAYIFAILSCVYLRDTVHLH